MLDDNGHLLEPATAAAPRSLLTTRGPSGGRVTKTSTRQAPMTERIRRRLAARRAEAEFERLLRPHLDYLYKLAYRFTGAADRADDLIQDLVVRLYPRFDELAAVEQLRPWLVRVMYRMFVDQRRRDLRAPYVAVADSGHHDAGEGDPYAAFADPGPGPDTELELSFNRTQLLAAWERLSDEHKALLTLYEIEGYTLNEIETMLELPRGTIKSRLHRARARLAELLGGEPSGALERVRTKREA